MKKIFNGQLYDTSKAKLCGEWDNGLPDRDFNACYESLHQKENGKFFLYGEGGLLTEYAVCHGNETSGSRRITPLTLKEAKAWAEEYLDADEYIAIFGDSDENNEKTTITIEISKTIAAKAKQQSTEKGVSLSDYIASLIQ